MKKKKLALKEYSIKDANDVVVSSLVNNLSTKGRSRLLHFGTFKIREIKGRKVYSFKKQAMVPVKPYKIIVFVPAPALRSMLNR